MRSPHTLLAIISLIPLALAARGDLDLTVFNIKDTYVGRSFFDSFDFATFDDPTHGRVNYVSQEEATHKNLSYASGDKFVMRADYTHKVARGSRGRDSIRIQSHTSYTDSVTVLDLTHMPEGCATWPAFWTISAQGPWPRGGEIDGVNINDTNLASQHTTPGCTMSNPRPMTGQSVSTNCDAQFNFNQGCGVRFSKPNSYGASFNNAGGGWYVMQRMADDGVSVWFWSRDDPWVPSAVKEGVFFLVPDESWGEPEAYFPTMSCSANYFDAHDIIFDLTFCGDWAGTVYGTSGCPGNCTDFVDNYPQGFAKAFWEINSLRVYTPYIKVDADTFAPLKFTHAA